MDIKTNIAGTLRQWYCDVGDIMEAGEPLGEIETDQLDVELVAPQDGRITEMLVLPGDAVTSGMILARIEPVSQSFGDLLVEPERKQKRKTHAAIPPVTPLPCIIMLMGLVAVVGIGALGMIFSLVRVASVSIPMMTPTPTLVGPRPSSTPIPPPNLTPTALFDPNLWDWSQPLQLVEAVNDWPAGSPVMLRATWIDPDTEQRLYEVVSAATGEAFTVPENMIAPSGLPTPQPTMLFDEGHWAWFYPLVLQESVADFPVGTRVKLISATYMDTQWQLQVVTENGFLLNVRESQLNYPPDVPPDFYQTPTVGLANYINLDGYPLVTTEQVDHIPPNTPVRALQFEQGFGEWVYRIVMQGDERVATARESQLRVR